MKKLFPLCFLFGFFLFPITSFADEEISITTSNNQDSYFFGRSIEPNVSIPGDLVTAGYSIRLDEPVGQDFSAAGFIIQTFADIGDDARIAGQMITIVGKIGDSLLVTGNEIIIRDGSEIGGDLWASGNTIELNAPVKGNAHITAEKVTINARISGNAIIHARDIVFEDSGYIAGSLDYSSPVKSVSEGKVEGGILYHELKFAKKKTSYFERKLQTLWSSGSLLFLVSVLAIGAVFLHFAKNYWVTFSEYSRLSPFTSLGIGFLMLISFLAAAVLFAISVIGLPLSAISILLLAVLSIVACIMDGLVIGNFIFPITKKTSFSRMFGSFALGTFILFLLPILPFGLGCVIAFLVFLAALGAVGRCHWGLILAMRKAKKV